MSMGFWETSQESVLEVTVVARRRLGGPRSAYCGGVEAGLKGSLLYGSKSTTFWKRQNHGDSRRSVAARSWATEVLSGSDPTPQDTQMVDTWRTVPAHRVYGTGGEPCLAVGFGW